MMTVRLGEVCQQCRESIKSGERGDLSYVGLESIESNSGQFVKGALSKTPETPQANSFRFGPEHILYGKLRPYLNKVALPDFEGKCSTEIIPLLPSAEADRAYLAFFLRSQQVVDQISARTAGARMPRADMDFVLSLPVPLPPLPEQHRIVDLLSRAERHRPPAPRGREESRRTGPRPVHRHVRRPGYESEGVAGRQSGRVGYQRATKWPLQARFAVWGRNSHSADRRLLRWSSRGLEILEEGAYQLGRT